MERVKTGIDGMDSMLFGGIPEGHTAVVMGAFGTGKTTFALQYIWQGLQNNEKGIYISLEEDEKSIVDTASSYGWDFEEYVKNESLLIVKLSPDDAKTTIKRIESDLPHIIKEFGAQRLVVDSISLLSMMYDKEKEKRDALFSLSNTIKESGTTSLFTAEVDPRAPFVSKEGIIEYVSDGVILLNYDIENEKMQLSLRIIKMRRIKHSRMIKPFSITDRGIVVHAESAVF